MSASLRNRRLFMGAGIIVALVIGLWMVFGSERYISTEDAYVQMDSVSLASQVDGLLVAVPVTRNQRVKKGQLLAQVDPTPYRIAVTKAEANLQAVKNQLLAEQAKFKQLQAQLAQAKRDVSYNHRQLKRKERLEGVSVSQSILDKAKQDYHQAQTDQASLESQLQSLRAKLNGGPKTPVTQLPDYLTAKAALHHAKYQLENTRIVAPFAGQLGGSVPMKGQVVVSGLPLFTLVRHHSAWVKANMKETALTHVSVGDQATLEVDTYPDVTWKATVTSLSPAAGSEFALIPPQNASGNWIKVVQRIPVSLHLLPGQDDKPKLRAGMSVTVTIDTQTDTQNKTQHAKPQATKPSSPNPAAR